MVVLIVLCFVSLLLGPALSSCCNRFASIIAAIAHTFAVIGVVAFFEFLWFLEKWDISAAVLGMIAVMAIQRCLFKLLVALFLSREFKVFVFRLSGQYSADLYTARSNKQSLVEWPMERNWHGRKRLVATMERVCSQSEHFITGLSARNADILSFSLWKPRSSRPTSSSFTCSRSCSRRQSSFRSLIASIPLCCSGCVHRNR